MTTADALLAAVIASPDDDLPRLVYADFIEEAGHPLRAEFIRLQCALASADPFTAPAGWRIREKSLLHAHAADWLAPLREPGEPLAGHRRHTVFRRGFVEAVWLPAVTLVASAARLFAVCPVRELRVIFDRIAVFEQVMRCEELARLRALDVCDQQFGTRGAAAVAGSEHLRGLTMLRLPGCNLSDAAADVLCDSRLSLTELDVRHNPLTRWGKGRLRERFGAAVRYDPDPAGD